MASKDDWCPENDAAYRAELAEVHKHRREGALRAEIARLTSEVTQLRADLANAGAVTVEACRAECQNVASTYDNMGEYQAERGAERCAEALKPLSTLSPIAAAARVLLAQTEAANDPEIGPWLRALIEQDAKPPTEYERKVAQMKKDFPNGI